MLAQKLPVQVIEQGGIEARIYRVQQGYRVEVSGIGTQFFWHPGIFRTECELWDWLFPQFYALVDDGIVLGGEWMMLEGDFDGNGIYQDWFICQTARSWQGYDPLTNCCYTARTWQALQAKIDEKQSETLFPSLTQI